MERRSPHKTSADLKKWLDQKDERRKDFAEARMEVEKPAELGTGLEDFIDLKIH